MKILAVSRAFPAHGGGGMELAAWDVMTEWASQGHEVVGLTTPGSSGFGDAPFDVEVLPWAAGVYSSEWFEGTVHAAHRIRPDIVFGVSAGAHEIVKSPSPVGVRVMQAHGTSIEEARSALSRRSLGGVKNALGQMPGMVRDWDRYPRYDAVVAVGPGIVRSIGRYPRSARPRRTELIENGIDLPPAVPLTVALPERPFAAFIGRITHDKGPDIAVDALDHWTGDLVVVGDGPYESELRLRVDRVGLASRVHFIGRLSRPEIVTVLASASAVIAPSRRREGLPLVALETLAAGRPLIASASVADTFGATVPPGLSVGGTDPARIGALLRSATSAAEQGPVALPQRYRLDVSARRYIDLFGELLAADR